MVIRKKAASGVKGFYTKSMEEDGERIMAQRLASDSRKTPIGYNELGEPVFSSLDKGTNWSPKGEPARREPQPMMFGEGLGNQLGLEGPKYTVWRTYSDSTEPTSEELRIEAEVKAERRRQGAIKAQATRARNKERAAALKEKEISGEVLTGVRIYNTSWETDWEARAKMSGGMPRSIQDVAGTKFGVVVIMVRVYEKEDGRSMGLGEPLRDTRGREFYIQTRDREHMEMVFGPINWSRPLTEKEAEQFGVRF